MKTIQLLAKCSDLCQIVFPNGREHTGYVPDGIGLGGGDYVRIEVDIQTGKIVGWDDSIKESIEKLSCTAHIKDLVIEHNLAKSYAEVRRMIMQGAISFNGQEIESPDDEEMVMLKAKNVLRVGKKEVKF